MGYYVAIKKRWSLGSKVPLYIYIKIFKLKKKKDEAAPYVVIHNNLQDMLSEKSNLRNAQIRV